LGFDTGDFFVFQQRNADSINYFGLTFIYLYRTKTRLTSGSKWSTG